MPGKPPAYDPPVNPPASSIAPRVVIVVPPGEEARGRVASDALGLPLVTDPAEVATALGDSWVAFGGLEMSRMLGRAARSPLVGRLATHSVTIGIAYRSR